MDTLHHPIMNDDTRIESDDQEVEMKSLLQQYQEEEEKQQSLSSSRRHTGQDSPLVVMEEPLDTGLRDEKNSAMVESRELPNLVGLDSKYGTPEATKKISLLESRGKMRSMSFDDNEMRREFETSVLNDEEDSSSLISNRRPRRRARSNSWHGFSGNFFLEEDEPKDEEEVDDENGEESPEQMILDAVDRIEDEIDEFSFSHLLPLPIRLFFENHLFGWSHLCTDILGHILYPLFFYFLTYYLFTWIFFGLHLPSQILEWIKDLGKAGVRDMDPFDSTDVNTQDLGKIVEKGNGFVMEHESAFRVIRVFFSILSFIIAFRTVRRRRRVWLRSSYGTKEYLNDAEHRQIELIDVDRTTLLGRLRKRRDRMLANRVKRKIQKASSRFERKRRKHRHKRRKRSVVYHPILHQIDNYEEERRMLQTISHDEHPLSESISVIPYAHGGFFGAAPFMLADPQWIDILRTLMPDVYVEVARRIFAPTPKLIHWAENNPVVAAYGTTQELENNGKVSTIEWDVFLDPGLVWKLDGILMERDCAEKRLEYWNSKRRRGYESEEDEDEFHALLGEKRRGNYSEEDIYQSIRDCNDRLLYLDSEVQKTTIVLLEKMMIAHGNLTQLVLEQTGYLKRYVFSRVKRTRRTLGGGIFARQWLTVYAKALQMCMMKASDSAEDDITEITEDEMVISPSSSSSDEDTGTDRSSSPIRIQQSSGCGTAETTNPQEQISCEVYTTSPTTRRAKRRCHRTDSYHYCNGSCRCKRTPPSTPSPSSHKSTTSPTSLNALTLSTCPNTSIPQSISLIRSILQAPIGLVLDLKSRHVPKRIWALIIDALRDAGARVEGVASFIPDEIRGISSLSSIPVKEVFFFHSAGDVQKACHDGILHDGDAVFFNAGSLLWEPSSEGFCKSLCKGTFACFKGFDGEEFKRNYGLNPAAIFGDSTHSSVRDYKRKYNLSIGLYCQEFAIDEVATEFLIRYVNHNSDVFDLGFSWGGVNGVTVRGIQPGKFTSTDGFWNQRYLGWNWEGALWPDGERVFS